MKITHKKEHDTIVAWIYDNPEIVLKQLGINEPFTVTFKKRQPQVKIKTKTIGNFDLRIKYQYTDANEIDPKTDDYAKKDVLVDIVVNVEMESASEQLRELNKLRDQNNLKIDNKTKQIYAVISKNATFKEFFTDEKYLFYKFVEKSNP
jgi:hypothetical protein